MIVVLPRQHRINPLPGRGCPQFANWGWEWNSGDNPIYGTCKDLLKLSALLSLFLCTASNVSARIPLPALRATFSPGEGFMALSEAI